MLITLLVMVYPLPAMQRSYGRLLGKRATGVGE